MGLGDRQLKILQAIIKDFITTAEPIGSRTLAKKYDLGISSATIRNEMADLEELGYLEQPHTSSGRIPSDKGYRLYVDHLMKNGTNPQKQKNEIKKKFIKSVGEIEQIIENTAKFISETTKLTSIVLSPQLKQGKLKYVKLVSIDSNVILLIVVSETGIVKNTIIRVDEDYTFNDLEIISRIIDFKLKGIRICDITAFIIENMYEEVIKYSAIVKKIFPALMNALEEMVSIELYLEGLTNIFDLPEYHNIDRARNFMTLLDQKEYLIDLLLSSKEELDITIGKENKHLEMKNCSLITATYQYNGFIVGKIGVIGPTRMDYSYTTSVVRSITRTLSEILNEDKRK
ncbi:heat-inducible transcription repressor HrcA [Lutibacter sp. B2]|nr:heat-inducible transcription repressor HrcA [Lutibacter sp. B2]